MVTAGTVEVVTSQVWRSMKWCLAFLSHSPTPDSRDHRVFLVAQAFNLLQLVAGPGGECSRGRQSRHRKSAVFLRQIAK